MMKSDASTSGQVFAAYHLIKGRNRLGYIVDPGAASGIVGADTLLEHSNRCPGNFSITPGHGNFTGINGTPLPLMPMKFP